MLSCGFGTNPGYKLQEYQKTQLMQVKPNTKSVIQISSSPKCYVCEIDPNYTVVKFTKLPITYGKIEYKFTTTANTKYISLRLGIQDSNYTSYEFTDIQLEQNEEATDVVEHQESEQVTYIDKPLYGIENVRDELDYAKGKITRNCGYVLFDFLEALSLRDDGYFQIKLSNSKLGLGICSHFRYAHNTKEDGTFFIVENYARFYKSDITTTTDFNAYMLENNVELVYLLATPTVEDIDCSDKITQYDEQTTVYNTDNAEIEVSLTNNTAIAEVNENLDKIEKITNNYSLEEQIIGKWINRKPLYRKVVVKEFEVSSQSSGLINLPHGIVNVKEVTGVCAFSENGQRLPYIDSTGGITILDVVSQSHIQIRYQNSSWNKVKWYFVLEYTKTTD